MPLLSRIANRLLRLSQPCTPAIDSTVFSAKRELIDYVFQQLEPGSISFADLGGVWRVDGAYTFYALDSYPVARAFLVDTDFTEKVRDRQKAHPNLTLINKNFGDPSVSKKIQEQEVDAILLFDVLLHQVKPDWDEILKMYAPATRWFVIYNQQFTAAEHTVRLLDLGEEGYFQNVPCDRDHPTYKALFEHMDEMHPQHKRPWRDIHNVWQWGITDVDLVAKLYSLGFAMQYMKNYGRFDRLTNFENHAFVFRKK